LTKSDYLEGNFATDLTQKTPTGHYP